MTPGNHAKLKGKDLESKILETYSYLLQLAKEAKIKLPHEV